MADHAFTNGERQLLAVLATREWVRMRTLGDPGMEDVVDELESAARKLSGEDVRLVARHA